ncbi:MAG: cobalamin-dependent protein, partial [Oligoflexia bacterium]|nr:cobalamin-dependent protein [Oligoflexia bacterium]
MTDIVFINPGNRKKVFQSLGIEVSAIEPPFCIAAMAAYLRNKGFSVAIIDSNAENFTPEETARLATNYTPLLVAVIVYGSQPSASTQNMPDAYEICRAIKENSNLSIVIGGPHPSALPELTIKEGEVDFLLEGEGTYTLEILLNHIKKNIDIFSIKGLWWKDSYGDIFHNKKMDVAKNLDDILPVAAWDLLPMEKYRAHNWHCFDYIEKRKPYAAIYTSFGCPYNCVFCCINAPFGKPSIRYRTPQVVLSEIDLLVKEYGVKNLKIIDELFIFKTKHYLPILEGIIDRGYNLNIWAYARIDTIDEKNLRILKKAGINWLAIGIESADIKFKNGNRKRNNKEDIKNLVKQIQSHGIRIIGNYIFGLPEDDLTSLKKTLDLAKELNCEFANFYSAMAYPGSALYNIAIEKKWDLPNSWSGFSQHSHDTYPLPTNHLTAPEVLKFRDDAFQDYFLNENYLSMINNTFGKLVCDHIK